MGIFDDVNDGVKAAMKAKDMPRVQTMRLIKNALQTAAKDNGTEDLADNDSVAVLRKLSKQRVESITAYEDAGRAELAADEKAELAVIDEFLPSLADEATTRKWVQDAIDKSGATDASQMGKVMGLLMKEHKGEMDGALAKTLAEEILKVQRPPPPSPQPPCLAVSVSNSSAQGGKAAAPKSAEAPTLAAKPALADPPKAPKKPEAKEVLKVQPHPDIYFERPTAFGTRQSPLQLAFASWVSPGSMLDPAVGM